MVKTNGKHTNLTVIYLKIFLILGISLVLFGIGFCALKVHMLSQRQADMKKDYMVVNNVSRSFNLTVFAVILNQFVIIAGICDLYEVGFSFRFNANSVRVQAGCQYCAAMF
jgi:hypothetical protein